MGWRDFSSSSYPAPFLPLMAREKGQQGLQRKQKDLSSSLHTCIKAGHGDGRGDRWVPEGMGGVNDQLASPNW